MASKMERYIADDTYLLKDARPLHKRVATVLRDKIVAPMVFFLSAVFVYGDPQRIGLFADLFLLIGLIYFWWLMRSKIKLPLKMPKTSGRIDPRNTPPGGGKPRKAEGILFLGNDKDDGEELWITNSDARTHILYLGTTGSGKTEGLKSLAANTLGWGSGFIYIDGKADTDLWSSISALARRFGRDDDLMVLNYMTGNSDLGSASNTINPFSYGSASYLTNMMVSLMPEAQGDNAMWKDRAVALIAALMPILTWKRANQEFSLNVNTLREALAFKKIVEYSREEVVPERLRRGLKGYLDTLPGYNSDFFADDGSEKPGPGGQAQDLSVVYQQHGYLAMQFTRSLQSLADDYGYIFEAPEADIDIHDVVLNRRILVVLIPALEKSGDETANLGKILASMLKGMMGGTLGSQVEGDTAKAIENKPTRAPTPFMTIFDEVGYYTVEGMAVMAAQARSLGFCLVFAAQDLPALQKRVKEEARSITANCNLKIFGKLEDPTDTKDFYDKTTGKIEVTRTSGYQRAKTGGSYDQSENVQIVEDSIVSYKSLKNFREGEAVLNFGKDVVPAKFFFANPVGIKALRVHKMLPLMPSDPEGKRSGKDIDNVLERINDKGWTAENAIKPIDTEEEIAALASGFSKARKAKMGFIESGAMAVTHLANVMGVLDKEESKDSGAVESSNEIKAPPIREEKKVSEPLSPSSKKSEEKKKPMPDTSGTKSWAQIVAGGASDDEEETEDSTDENDASKPKKELRAVREEDSPESLGVDQGETLSWAEIIAGGGKQDKEEKKEEKESELTAAPSQEKEPSLFKTKETPSEEEEDEPAPAIEPIDDEDTSKETVSEEYEVEQDSDSEESPDDDSDRPLTWAEIIQNKDKE